MAESDEYWSYLMASAYALVGEEEGGAGVDGACGHGPGVDRLCVYFTRHDRFLESLRTPTGGSRS